ncbi:MAG: hypothetical protein ACRCVU_06485 [Flavobacterium sp.]|uniref:Uncharacterized protein n=1 Tax=Myroides marinus TaxID=703342 RepID=A0A161UTX6_9FLAO|nr:hypothetical protein [Myroides marinus]KUF44953.1 hypothetical protein AS361_09380 [Myroides marinus]KZE81231.1 hypothetical protein AV926_08035 [Myroides marinus]
MKKLLILGVVFTAFIGGVNASTLENEASFTKVEASFLVQNNYIVVVVVKTSNGSIIEINGEECARRYVQNNGGEIIGYKSVPASGPTPFRCADLPGSDGEYPNVINPGSGGGGGGSTGGGGGGKHKFKRYNPDEDVFN